MTTIGRTIKEAMTSKGWLNADLAEACGVSVATASRWATGVSVPHSNRWPDIEEALGIPAGKLAGDFYGDVRPPDPELSSRVDELMRKHEDLASIVADLARRVVQSEQHSRSSRRPHR